MPRAKHPQIVTANDLYDGDVVYLRIEGSWTRKHDEAAVAHDADEAQRLLAIGEGQADRIVGAYLADVTIGADGQPRPLHFREAFRTRGPSNYFHGKQAEL